MQIKIKRIIKIKRALRTNTFNGFVMIVLLFRLSIFVEASFTPTKKASP
jgi:hypothetical protein